MGVQYSVKTHPLLTDKAKAVIQDNEDGFTQHNLLAELLLGLDGTLFTGDDADVAKLAVALQVNFQIQQGLDPFITYNINSSAVQSKGTTWRGYKVPPIVHAQARRITDSLTRGSQEVISSVRTR